MNLRKIGKIVGFVGIVIFGLSFLELIPIPYGNDVLIIIGFILYFIGTIFQFTEKNGGFILHQKNLFFILGSVTFITGLIFRYLYYPYASQLLIIGIGLSIWGRFSGSTNNLADKSKNEILDDDKNL